MLNIDQFIQHREVIKRNRKGTKLTQGLQKLIHSKFLGVRPILEIRSVASSTKYNDKMYN